MYPFLIRYENFLNALFSIPLLVVNVVFAKSAFIYVLCALWFLYGMISFFIDRKENTFTRKDIERLTDIRLGTVVINVLCSISYFFIGLAGMPPRSAYESLSAMLSWREYRSVMVPWYLFAGLFPWFVFRPIMYLFKKRSKKKLVAMWDELQENQRKEVE